ncbi:OpgC domain-containing protein [Afipia sp. DC4300-2b1]|uniref:OpgC domain-containing protein n=1 Tax=Afipia sp. DC4300-2b1 TaxID=2804672 RepID=UPI003CEFA270
MTIRAFLPAKGRDLRLDLFRGLANWAIFLDHVPNNAVAWLTTRNYGFTDAADIFVFISGYTAAFVYAKSMLVQGFVVGTARLLKRVWQLYIAHVLLFVFYIAAIGWVVEAYNHSHLVDEFNVAGLIDRPMLTLKQGLLLKFKPLNLDVLPLYIVLMAAFPLVLWLMLRRPDLAIASSLVLYFTARQFGWNLPAYPSGVWYFNPFTWQLLFALGAWSSLGGASRLQRFIRSPAIISICFVYLGFALFMTVAGYVAPLGKLIPEGLFGAFNPNDKTNLAPYRILHFVALAVLVVRFFPFGWPGLKSHWLRPLIICGQRSLEVFCVGVFLSFVGHFLLELVSDSLLAQIIVSVSGIALMTAVAYYRSWSKDLDKQPAASKSSSESVSTSVS